MLDKNRFMITDVSLFQKDKMNAARGYFALVQNPTKSELLRGVYKPRLTLTKRFNYTGRFEPTLSIEFSAPKLLFGNNFDELCNEDFPVVIEKLCGILKEMGVRVFTRILEISPLSAIHYSKNIPLTDGTTPRYYISKIQEANIKLSLDINHTDYCNDGHSYKWHCNSYEVAFYDKIRDIEAAKGSDKRAIERDNALQLNLFDTFKERKRLEVLRMEVRLNTRQTIGKLLKSLGIETDLTFQKLFDSKKSQRVLLHYLDEINRLRPKILDYTPSSTKVMLADLMVDNPEMTARTAFEFIGLRQVLCDTNLREVRIILGKKRARSVQRVLSDAAKIRLPRVKNPFGAIREHLIRFDLVKIVDFQENMLNNVKYHQT